MMHLGCIADDFTGASDLANMLTRQGMPTTQYVGVPRSAESRTPAGVISLKTRSCPPGEAVAQSLEALAWLRGQGCRQFLFKYCSTFDSTPEGNIGPVATALIEALGARGVVVCPAFPANGRTVYQGHLFVGDRLLSESGMEHHPLTPMTDPDIRRWLALQTPISVGHIGYPVVAAGPEAIREALAAADPLVVVDAITDGDLFAIGAALDGAVLVTGGSGIALGLPENFRRAGLLSGEPEGVAPVGGPGFVISGSTSPQSRRQVAEYAKGHPSYQVTAREILEGRLTPGGLAETMWAERGRMPMAYSTVAVEDLRAAQAELGAKAAAEAIEGFFGALARDLVGRGAGRIAVGGGETSGAVITALGLDEMEVGQEIDPGVPALVANHGGRPLGLALKSGNFGGLDFFERALGVMEAGS